MSDYNEIYRNTPIVQDPRMNGRVNLIEPEDPTIQFKMQERIVLKNKSSEYRDALTGELECTPLSTAYFSAENVQIIQNGLRAGVYAKSGNQFVIARVMAKARLPCRTCHAELTRNAIKVGDMRAG